MYIFCIFIWDFDGVEICRIHTRQVRVSSIYIYIYISSLKKNQNQKNAVLHCSLDKPSPYQPTPFQKFPEIAKTNKQWSLYYQPKECTMNGKSLKFIQIYHTFSLFDALQISILMIPGKSEFWLHMVFLRGPS